MPKQQELDWRGLKRPLPLNRLDGAMGAVAKGATLKVIATDPGSVADVAAFSRRTGHEIVDQSAGEGEFVFVLRKV